MLHCSSLKSFLPKHVSVDSFIEGEQEASLVHRHPRGTGVHSVTVARSPSRDVQQLIFEKAIQANANSKSLLALAEMDSLVS